MRCSGRRGAACTNAGSAGPTYCRGAVGCDWATPSVGTRPKKADAAYPSTRSSIRQVNGKVRGRWWQAADRRGNAESRRSDRRKVQAFLAGATPARLSVAGRLVNLVI